MIGLGRFAAAAMLAAAGQPGGDGATDVWLDLIEQAPETVARGYRGTAFAYNGNKWRQVMRCDAPPAMAVDIERTCLVCSIDDVGGATYGGKTVPHTTVAIGVAYARFRRDDVFAWRLFEYEPFGSNHRAQNGEYRHRASVRWITDQALTECEDMNMMSGTERL